MASPQYPKHQIEAADSASVDAFGRWVTASPGWRFDNQTTYQATGLGLVSVLNGTGSSVAQDANYRDVLITCGANAGAYARLVSPYHIPYTPGRATQAAITGVLAAAKANVQYRMGLFDELNGFYLASTSNGVVLAKRSSVNGGVAVTTEVSQASWNIDPFDGTGPSGVTLDITKTHILLIDIQALYVGRVRMGFDIDGVAYWAHQFVHANSNARPYIAYASLPVHWEIVNTAGAASASTMYGICCSVWSSGGESLFEMDGYPFAYSNTTAGISLSTRRPVLSLRPRATFGDNSSVFRGLILPKEIGAYAATHGALVEVVKGGGLTGASWVNASIAAYSAAEVDVSATAITNGIVIASLGVVPASASFRSSGALKLGRLILSNDYLGTTAETLSIVATSMAATNATVVASIGWEEIR